MTPPSNTAQDDQDLSRTETREPSLFTRLKMLAEDDFEGKRSPPRTQGPAEENAVGKRKMTEQDGPVSIAISKDQKFKKLKSLDKKVEVITVKRESPASIKSSSVAPKDGDKPASVKIEKPVEVVTVKKEHEVKPSKEKVQVKEDKIKPLKEKIQVKKESEVKVKKEVVKKGSMTTVKVKKESTSRTVDKDTECEEEAGEEEEEYRWWENQREDGSIKWESLEHNGPYFPPPYTPINIPLIYDKRELLLEPEAEEVAGFFAALLNSDHASNPIFRRNFFDDFCAVLAQIGSVHAKTIVDLEKCDFTKMHAYFEHHRELRKNATKGEREAAKEAKKQIDDKYGFCLLDSRKEKVGNFRIEPPGLFRGRGTHPKTGKLKSRVRPEQVTLNLGKGALIPQAPAGHGWGAVQHDRTVTWLATWTENINKSQKYVFLAPGSSLKGQSDYKKFETARLLKHHVDHIRGRNREELQSSDMFVRQRATALWLIDNLALRAGNEKGDDEADTVGCCSLRLEHVTLRPPNGIVFDFLGKDSIRYYRELDIDPQIIKNLGIFMKAPKEPGHPIFDRLNTQLLNKYLGELMPGLTAKVFRTFNASFTFQRELDAGTLADASIAEKILAYNRANRQVAILCNHQRSIPKTHGQAMERLGEKLSILKYERRLLRNRMKSVMSKKERAKIVGIDEDESDLDVGGTEQLLLAREAERATKKRVKGEDDSELSPSPSSSSNKTTPVNPLDQLRDRIGRMKEEAMEKKFVTINSRLSALRLQMTDRDENKTTALGTSKMNYIDPRITAAWCSRHGVPLEKMFNKTLRDKFKWAMSVDREWTF